MKERGFFKDWKMLKVTIPVTVTIRYKARRGHKEACELDAIMDAKRKIRGAASGPTHSYTRSYAVRGMSPGKTRRTK